MSIEGNVVHHTGGTDIADADIEDDITITSTKKISNLLATEQFRLSFDANNYATWTVAADGALTLVTVDNAAAEGDINLNPDGFVGIKTAAPTVELDVTRSVLVSADTETLVLTLTGANADPAVTGELRYDSTVTGMSGGSLAWFDDDEIRYIVDLEALPVNDGEVVSYSAANDNFVMSAAGAGDVLADGSIPFTGEVHFQNKSDAATFGA